MISNRIPRFFIDNLQCIANGDQIAQIRKVLRLKDGDRIIGIHRNREYLLEIIDLTKDLKFINLRVVEELKIGINRELDFRFKLFIPILKNEKTELVLQKCTELGVNEFQFVVFQNSVREMQNWKHKWNRWQKILTEACEQSERLMIPRIYEPIGFKDIELSQNEIGVFFLERYFPDQKNTFAFNSSEHKMNKSLIFGPEGGFSSQEKTILQEKGFRAISLGERILRSETAIIVGSGLISYIYNSVTS